MLVGGFLGEAGMIDVTIAFVIGWLDGLYDGNCNVGQKVCHEDRNLLLVLYITMMLIIVVGCRSIRWILRLPMRVKAFMLKSKLNL